MQVDVDPGVQQSKLAVELRGVPLQQGTQVEVEPGAHPANPFDGSQHPAPVPLPPGGGLVPVVTIPVAEYPHPQLVAPLIPQQP
jgi:hypothetical protein